MSSDPSETSVPQQDLSLPSRGYDTPPLQPSDFSNTDGEPWYTGPPSPSIVQPPPPPPFPKFLPSSMTVTHDDSNRAEIGLLKLASAEGRLQDVQQILSQYMLSRADVSSVGTLRLNVFYESIVEAILHRHPSILSYLFSLHVGEPRLYVTTAIQARSSAIFHVFLEYGWDINEPLERTMPPALGYVSDDRALTEWFLDHGADPNRMCSWDLTPMSEAMCLASLDTITLLFDRGGDIKRGQLLHNAVQRASPDVLELVSFLLDRGISINEIQYQNHERSWRDRFPFGLGTPLHYAAQEGKVHVVKLLLSRGADPTIKDAKGRTVLQSAEFYRQTQVAELLQRNIE